MRLWNLRDVQTKAIILLMILSLIFVGYISFMEGNWLVGIIQIAVVIGILHNELNNSITCN